MSAGAQGFDPSRYLTKVGSADYLEVKWRLVWLREMHPDAIIETELTEHGDSLAVFRVRVAIPGGGSATGWGSEGYNDFRDYLEKAETKALGRALAALGFGTQFAYDFDEGAEASGVVDSPIDFSSTRGRRMNGSSNGNASGASSEVRNPDAPMSPRQQKFIEAIASENGLTRGDLITAVRDLYKVDTPEQLRRADASAFIDALQAGQIKPGSTRSAERQASRNESQLSQEITVEAMAKTFEWSPATATWRDNILRQSTEKGLDTVLGNLPDKLDGRQMLVDLASVKRAELAPTGS